MSELVDTFSNRLKIAMRIRNIKASELSAKTGIAKSSLSEYINGKYEAKQDGVFLLAKALNVNEAWLMGCDVPMEKNPPPTQKNDFRYANYNGINTKGLSKDEIEEINRFVEFIRNKKKSKKD